MTVTIYSKPGCNPCRLTKRQFDKYGLEYQDIDISQDPSAYETVKQLGYQQVPVVRVFDGDEVVMEWSGFNGENVKALALNEPAE